MLEKNLLKNIKKHINFFVIDNLVLVLEMILLVC